LRWLGLEHASRGRGNSSVRSTADRSERSWRLLGCGCELLKIKGEGSSYERAGSGVRLWTADNYYDADDDCDDEMRTAFPGFGSRRRHFLRSDYSRGRRILRACPPPSADTGIYIRYGTPIRYCLRTFRIFIPSIVDPQPHQPGSTRALFFFFAFQILCVVKRPEAGKCI
jgi:hypothetical protein